MGLIYVGVYVYLVALAFNNLYFDLINLRLHLIAASP